MTSKNIHVFIWKDFKEWKPALESMFQDILTPELEAKAQKHRASVKNYYPLEAFEKLIKMPTDTMFTTKKIDEFRERYSHIRTYHACRPVDIKKYYEKGILTLSKEVQHDRFRSIFISVKFSELTEEMLQQCIQKAAPYSVGTDGELCLAIDDRHIIDMCDHYLIIW